MDDVRIKLARTEQDEKGGGIAAIQHGLNGRRIVFQQGRLLPTRGHALLQWIEMSHERMFYCPVSSRRVKPFRHGVRGTQGLDQRKYPMCPLAVWYEVQSSLPMNEGNETDDT